MTAPDSAGLIAPHLADQLAGLDRRISSANSPGNLDGLFACHILQKAAITSSDWQVSPVTERWLEQSADRLTDAPQLAALGYGLTQFGDDHASSEARRQLAAGLGQLMRRDPYPPDRVTFPNDPRQLIGIALAVKVVHDELPQADAWLRQIIDDRRFRAGDTRHDLIRQHVRSTLSGGDPEFTVLPDTPDAVQLALVYWMTVVGTARFADPAADLSIVQQGVLNGILCVRAADLPVPDAALLRAAAGRIIEASVDIAVLNRDHVGVVLRRFTPAMRRWRYDDPARIKQPVQWPVNAEREVQDIVWLLLRSAFGDVVDEEPLRKLGHSSYIADFGIPSLGVLVEIKNVRAATDFKHIEKQIYDASASVQEYALTADALLGIEHMADVIIVSRPSQLPAPGTAETAKTGPKKRRAPNRI